MIEYFKFQLNVDDFDISLVGLIEVCLKGDGVDR